MSRKRTAYSNLFFHIASMIIASVGALWTMSSYVEYIPLHIYGAWLATGNILAWATMIDPGLGAVVQQKVAEAFGGNSLNRIGSLAVTGSLVGFVISSLVFVVCAVLIFFLPLILGEELPKSGVIERACWVAAIGSALTVASYAMTSVLLGLQVSVSIGIVYILSLSLSLIVQIVLVREGWGVMGIAIGVLIRGGLAFSSNLILMICKLNNLKAPLAASRKSYKEIAQSISYTFVSRLVGTVAGNLDSLIVARFIGAEAAPVLRATRASIDISVGMVNRPAAAISPVISHIDGAGEYHSKMGKITRLFELSVWVTMLAAGGIYILNEKFVTLWVGKELYAGYEVNASLTVWMIVSSFIALFSNILIALGYFKDTSLISLGQSILNVGMSFILAVAVGMIGIPLAAGITSVLALGAFIILGKRTDKLPTVLLKVSGIEFAFGVLAAAFAVWAVSYGIKWVDSWVSFIIVGIAYCGVFLVLITFLSVSFRKFLFEIAMVIFKIMKSAKQGMGARG